MKLKLTKVSYYRSYIVLVHIILSAFTKLKRIEHLSHVTFLTMKFSRSTVLPYMCMPIFERPELTLAILTIYCHNGNVY